MTRGCRWILLLALTLFAGGDRTAFAQESGATVLDAGAEAQNDADVRAARFEPSAPESDDVAARAETAVQIARASGGEVAALAKLVQFTRGCGAAAGARAIDELALAHVAAGDLNLAAGARRALVEQFPGEPLAADALVWLARLYSSSEIARVQNGSRGGDQSLGLPASKQGGQRADGASAVAASTAAPATTAYAIYLVNQAVRINPELNEDVRLRFQRSVAVRALGDVKSANRFLAPMARVTESGPWTRRAQAEMWLDGRREGAIPTPTLPCAVAATPPHLDGVFDEAMWQAGGASDSATEETLGDGPDGGDSEIPPFGGGGVTAAPERSLARLAYDEQFLYIAIRCPKAAGVDYSKDERPRPRDGELRDRDRVRLRLDLDRDYATWFELTADSRGWTFDGCCEDAAWNPQWFVAAGEDGDEAGDYWTVEAAIAWSELAGGPPKSGAVWACAVERLRPGAEDAAESSTGADEEGDAWRLVLFQ